MKKKFFKLLFLFHFAMFATVAPPDDAVPVPINENVLPVFLFIIILTYYMLKKNYTTNEKN
jgi:hypothetical protein